MKPINFHPNEIIYTSSDPKILDLPVLQVQYSDGQTALLSCWKPSRKDRLRVLFGKPIYAGLLSPVQPPIFISTEDEVDKPKIKRLRVRFTPGAWHISLVPLFWINWSSHFCIFIFGSSVSKSLLGIDTATLSKLQPVHSLFWTSFTKRTSGTGNYQSK